MEKLTDPINKITCGDSVQTLTTMKLHPLFIVSNHGALAHRFKEHHILSSLKLIARYG